MLELFGPEKKDKPDKAIKPEPIPKKPIKEPVGQLGKLPKIKPEKLAEVEEPDTDEVTDEKLKLEIDAIDLNGVPCLMLYHEDSNSKTLGRKFGFQYLGHYMYAEIKDQISLKQTIMALKKHKFVISPITAKVLDSMVTLFKGEKNKQKAMSKMKSIDKRNFFNPSQHKKPKDPNELRLYPVVEDGELFLYCDLTAGAPAALRLKKLKKLPEAPKVRWYLGEDLWVYHGTTAASLKSKVKAMKDHGIKIVNYNDLLEQVADLSAVKQ